MRDLAALLASMGVKHREGVSENELSLGISADLPRGMRIRWDAKLPFITFEQVLLHRIPTSRMPELERAVVRANFHLPVLGFCLDHECETLSYRVSAPSYGGVDPGLVDRLVKGAIATSTEFRPAFQQVIDGRAGSELPDVYRTLRRQQRVHLVYADTF